MKDAPQPRTIDRRIVGFALDDAGDWMAVLECGHTWHVRHDPPWMNRPWVTTPQGRAGKIGSLLPCVRCVEQDG